MQNNHWQKIVKVDVTTTKPFDIFWCSQPMQRTCFVKKTHLTYKCDFANMRRTSSMPRLYRSLTARFSSGVR